MEKASVVVPEKELPYELIGAGTKLQTPPDNVDEILALLDSVEGLLISLEQAPSHQIRHALLPAIRGLISEKLFRHADVDVKISVLSCIHEVIRIFAPDAPYEGDIMKEIFQQTVEAFEQLSLFPGRRYDKAVHILETVAKLRSCLMLLDQGCDELVIQMFQQLLGRIRSNHKDTIFTYMEDLMTSMIEETDEISLDLLRPLLVVRVRGENQNISPESSRLAAKVLKNCSARLKPYLLKVLEQMRRDVEAFTDIVVSVLSDTQAGENVAKESEKGASDPVLVLGDGTTEQSDIHKIPLVDTLVDRDQVEQLEKVPEESAKLDSLERQAELKAQSSQELLPRRKGRKPVSYRKLEEGYECPGLSGGRTSSKVYQKRKKKESVKDVVVRNKEGSQCDSEMKHRTAQDGDAEENLPRSSKKPRNVKEYSKELLGSRVKIWWPDDQQFYEGVVRSYNPFKKEHEVVYFDGEVEVLKLKKEHWLLVDSTSSKGDLEANLRSSDDVPVDLEETVSIEGTQENAAGSGSSKESSQLQAQRHGDRSGPSSTPSILAKTEHMPSSG